MPSTGLYAPYVSDWPEPIGTLANSARLIAVSMNSAWMWTGSRDTFATNTAKHASCGGPDAASMSTAQ